MNKMQQQAPQHPSEHHGMPQGSHSNHHQMMIEDFKSRFFVSLALTLPIVVLSPMIQELFRYHIDFPERMLVLFLLSSGVFFYGGFPFLKGTVDEIRSRTPGMMTLIGVAVTSAYVYSSAVAFGVAGEMFFWELATLISIMLLGHWIEMKSVMGAGRALELLVKLLPAEAHLLQGDQVTDIPLDKVNKNDLLLIKPGEKIPADGIVVDGESHVNESMLTGESKLVKKGKNDKVIGGSLNGNGSLKVRVEHTGQDSYLAKVIHLVEEAQKTKSRTQQLADRAAFWLTLVALGGGFTTLFVWLSIGKTLGFAVERMVTVMVISCPHALGLAVPLVVAISTTLSAQRGLLIRDRTAFENARKITTLVFDKTGTLTKGEFGVARYRSWVQDISPDEMLKLAAGVEKNSEHPISAGIVKKAKEIGALIPNAIDFQALPGQGVMARVDGKTIKVVSPRYLTENHLKAPGDLATNQTETVVYVIVNERLTGFIALADQIRPESYAAIETLKKIPIKTLLLTGDNEAVAQAVSKELKMDSYFAQVLPHQKLDKIKELQNKKEFVAMTGDGVNDAPALAQADVGIAVGSGTDVAAETADIILVNSNPQDIVSLILFGRATYKKMMQNLAWAAGYNVITIPLAAGVLYKWGILLSPALGAVLMSMSTVIVAFNAQMLKHWMKLGTGS